MPQGTVKVSYADETTVGETQKITADVSDQIHGAITQGIKDVAAAHRQKIVTANLPISEGMKAELIGDPADFKVTEQQNSDSYFGFDPTGTIHWSWLVKPLTAGTDRELELVITALVRSKAGNQVIPVQSKILPLRVRANFPYVASSFLGENWKYIVSTLVALGTLWFSIYQYRHRRIA